MKYTLEVRTTVTAIHNYPESHVLFLKHPHQHDFTIICHIEVGHENRQIEFYDFYNCLNEFIHSNWETGDYGVVNFGVMSCEQIGRIILEKMELVKCGVFEDAKMGAWVEME